MPAKLTTKDFISNAKKLHGNKYNYDKINYTNSMSKVSIYCNKCNKMFEQKPTSHTQGRGCPCCTSK